MVQEGVLGWGELAGQTKVDQLGSVHAGSTEKQVGWLRHTTQVHVESISTYTYHLSNVEDRSEILLAVSVAPQV